MSPERAQELLSQLLRYEELLLELKNKNAGVDETPADRTAVTKPKDQLGYGYRET